jgi:hypothetical protein
MENSIITKKKTKFVSKFKQNDRESFYLKGNDPV